MTPKVMMMTMMMMTLTQGAETQFLKMEKDFEKTRRALVESQQRQNALQLGLVSTGLLKSTFLVNMAGNHPFPTRKCTHFHGGISISISLTIGWY